MSRLFVAVDPSTAARREIVSLQQRLREALDAEKGWKVSFPEPTNLHLTLRFLGELEPERAAAVAGALDTIGATDRFEIAFDTLGAFPDVRKPHVLWIAPSRADEVKALAARVDASLLSIGIAPDARPFRPHLTLARVRRAGRSAGRVASTG